MKTITLNNKPIHPSKVVCIGRNYVDHITELDNEMPTQPVIFMKPNSAISDVIKFNNKDAIHYESEISFTIRDGKLDAVGFGLDLTKRKIQSELKAKGLPWERAKSFDGSAIFSEFISFTGDIAGFRLELFINDQLTQTGGVDLMLYKPDEILKEISSFSTLDDGDVVMTGTPKGVGEINYGDRFVGKIFHNGKILLSKAWTAK